MTQNEKSSIDQHLQDAFTTVVQAWQRAVPWVAVLGLAVAFILIAARLMLSAFTSGDDGYTEMSAVTSRFLFDKGWEFAVFQGRFYQLIMYPIALLPFVGESIPVANAAKVLTLFAVLAGAFSLGRALADWGGAVLMSALFLGLYDTVGGSYNPIHGLPLWFAMGPAALAASFAAFIRHLRGEEGLRATAVFYGLALLTYEIVLLYLPLYVWLLMSQHAARQPQSGIKRIVSDLKPLFWITGAYLIAYAAWRVFYPGTYSGAQGLSLGNGLWDMLRPILAFSWHGLYLWPGSPTARVVTLESLVFVVAVLLSTGAGLTYLWRANAAATAERPEPVRLPLKLPAWRVAVALLYAYFAPNVLYGFTERYRIWAGDGVVHYLGSIYSAFAVLAALVVGVAWAFRRWPAVSRSPFALTFALGTLAVLVLANSLQSEAFFGQSRAMAVRWTVADWAVRTMSNDAAVAGMRRLTVCGDGFSHTREWPVYFRNPDFIADVDIYWSRFFSRHLGRDVRYVGQPSANEGCELWLWLRYREGRARLLDPRGRVLGQYEFPSRGEKVR